MYREVTMVEVKEVLRLWRAGLPKKRIAAQLGLAPRTVRRLIAAATAAAVRGDAGAVTDEEVVGLATALRRMGASVEYPFRRGALSKQRKAAWTAMANYIVEVRPTAEGMRLLLRDGAGAGLISAVTNERTFGDILGEALLEPSDLYKVIRAHPGSMGPEFELQAEP